MTTHNSEQFPQIDSVKRAGLEHLIAAKLLEVVSQDDLEDSYYEMQLEWAESMPDNELLETAERLNIEI